MDSKRFGVEESVFQCDGPISKDQQLKQLHELFKEANSDKIIHNLARFVDCLESGVDNRGATALMLACERGMIEVVQHILVCLNTVKQVDVKKNSPLHYAALRGCEKCVSILLTSIDWTQLDPNAANSHGNTALHIAVQYKHLLIVKEMLRHPSVNVNLQNSYGLTPLLLALSHPQSQQDEILRLVLHNQFVDMTKIDLTGQTAAHFAALNGWDKALQLLTDEDELLLCFKDLRGMTPLHVSAMSKQYKCLDLLVRKCGVDPNLTCKLGRTALHWLLMSCHEHPSHIDQRTNKDKRIAEAKCLHRLLDHGAQINVADFNGCTPLLFACVMLRDPIDHCKAAAAITALSKVRRQELDSLLQLDNDPPWADNPSLAYMCYLLARGADPNWCNAQGQTFCDLVNPALMSTFSHFIDLHQSHNRVKCSVHNFLTVSKSGVAEKAADVSAQPCGHAVVCRDCAPKCIHLQACHICHSKIELLSYSNGDPVVFAEVQAAAQVDKVRLDAVLKEIDELRESGVCDICMDQKKSVALIPCGHTTCAQCCKPMHKCHICRQNINKRQPLFGVN